MPQITLTNEQVVELVRQLPLEQKRLILLALVSDAQTQRTERWAYAEAQLRARAAERGLSWDTLDDDAREAFVDDLLHEER